MTECDDYAAKEAADQRDLWRRVYTGLSLAGLRMAMGEEIRSPDIAEIAMADADAVLALLDQPAKA